MCNVSKYLYLKSFVLAGDHNQLPSRHINFYWLTKLHNEIHVLVMLFLFYFLQMDIMVIFILFIALFKTLVSLKVQNDKEMNVELQNG